MKKLLPLLLITFVLTFSSCSASNSDKDSDTSLESPTETILESPPETASESPSPTPTETALTGNIFLDAKLERHTSEDGGVTATISVNKETAMNISAEAYTTFIEKRLKDVADDCELFGIIFEDGTGVTFYGCDPSNAVYGEIDEKGNPVNSYGYILPNDDGTYTYDAYDDESDATSDATIQTLLSNMYQIGNGTSTTVSVKDGKAYVWLLGDFSFHSLEEKEELTSTFMELHNTARELIETLTDIGGEHSSYVLSTDICNSQGVPFYGIEDGEVQFDILPVLE